MPRSNTKSYTFDHLPDFIRKAVHWGASKHYLAFLNPNDISFPFDAFRCILAIGALDYLEANTQAFRSLEDFQQKHRDWMFGYLSYDLKNEIEDLNSKNPQTIDAPGAFFFIPETIIHIEQSAVRIESAEQPDAIVAQIEAIDLPPHQPQTKRAKLESRISKQGYKGHVAQIKELILEGAFYELNYCLEYHCSNIVEDPVELYFRLNEISPMPFSSFFKIGDLHIIGASPERFLKRKGNTLISQPIKGTIKRGRNKKEDDFLKAYLKNNEKERAENLMIVDLVRNDLAKSSLPGSVKVNELFGIYTFKQVHQMVSTITSSARRNISSVEIIKNAFPMGSMTGAPKIRVMEEIERIENSKRGIYSGASGYFKPNADFDLNVIIRTMIYDTSNHVISFHVGSAITYDADAEYEYHECMLKARAMLSML